MQYQWYQPLLPCANKRLQYKWDKHSYDIHKAKVQSAKSTVNTSPPKIYGHLLVKRKKQMLEEERISTINHENRILLDKITHIMQNTGRTDCKNEHALMRIDTRKRQEKLLEILRGNQMIRQRLSQCKPRYSVQSWHEQWMRTQYLMGNIGRFPRLSTAQVPEGVSQQTPGVSKDNNSRKSKTVKRDSFCSKNSDGVKEENICGPNK